MPNLFRNNAATTLASPVLTSDTTLVLATNTGARFPSPVIGEWFFVTVQSGVNFEIMKCTARAGDILTVERAQDGSSLQNWLAGNSVDMRIPRITLENFLQKNEVALLAAGSATAPSVTFGDTDTGIFGPAAGQVAVATNGVQRALFNEIGNMVIGGATALQRFNAINSGIGGGAPASSGNAADPNAVARFGAGSVVLDVGVTATGAMWLQARSVGNYATTFPLSLNPGGGGVNMVGPVTINGALAVGSGSATAPSVTFGDTDTGFFGPAAGQVAVATNGVQRALMDENGNLVIGGATALQRFNAINSGIGGGAPASSGSAADPNAVARFGAGSAVLDVGATATGAMWLQARSVGNYATNYPLSLNPNGGGVNMVGPVNVSSGDLDVAGNLRFNSGYGSAALAYGVRAWVNFNGTGTVAIRASGGVTSITDNGTGDYTVNFNFTMPDANYCVVGVGASSAPDMLPLGIKGDVPPTTTNVRVWVKSVGVAAGAFDPLYASIAIIR